MIIEIKDWNLSQVCGSIWVQKRSAWSSFLGIEPRKGRTSAGVESVWAETLRNRCHQTMNELASSAMSRNAGAWFDSIPFHELLLDQRYFHPYWSHPNIFCEFPSFNQPSWFVLVKCPNHADFFPILDSTRNFAVSIAMLEYVRYSRSANSSKFSTWNQGI